MQEMEAEEKAKGRMDTTIPDYLMCPLKLDFMDEPVVLSSGFTYEKDDIERHFA